MNDKQHSHFLENGALQQFSAQFPIIPGTFSPTGTFNDIYSILLPQNSADRSQNKPLETPYVFPDLPTWDNLKLPEKIDLIEISNKDLSPSSYYSNIDTIPTFDNQYNRFEAPQWSNNSSNINYGQKSANYPSCAVGKYYGDNNKSTTYCNIQKNPADREVFKSCAYYNTNVCYNQNKQADYPQNIYNNYSTFYDKYSDLTSESACFGQSSSGYSSLPQKSVANSKETFDLSCKYIVRFLSIECSLFFIILFKSPS